MSRSEMKRLLLDFGLPLAVLLLLTLWFRSSDIDMQVARQFYSAEGGWIHAQDWLWALLHKRGMIPGIAIGAVGLGGLCLGAVVRRHLRHWRVCLFLLLMLAIGPGLLVNTVFKDQWGRTRPKHVIELGGHLPFLKVWDRGEPGASKSFPSGHASIGFYTIAPFFLLRRRRKGLARAFLIGGTVYGALMGAGRIAQGGHFLSDVVWAWGMVFLTGMILYYLLKPDLDSGPEGSMETEKPCV